MRIPKSELRILYNKLLPVVGNQKFCVHDVKQYTNLSPNHIGMLLRLMWYQGYSNKHGKDPKRNVIMYSLRSDV